MTFVEILNDIMIDKNLNQTSLAKLIGVKQSQVSEWLKGKSKPGYDNLKAICIALNISADYLLGLDDKTKFKKNRHIDVYFLFFLFLKIG